MTATLTFVLPEEQEEHRTAVHAAEYRATVGSVLDYIRHRLKYEEPSTDASAELERVRQVVIDELGGLEA